MSDVKSAAAAKTERKRKGKYSFPPRASPPVEDCDGDRGERIICGALLQHLSRPSVQVP